MSNRGEEWNQWFRRRRVVSHTGRVYDNTRTPRAKTSSVLPSRWIIWDLVSRTHMNFYSKVFSATLTHSALLLFAQSYQAPVHLHIVDAVALRFHGWITFHDHRIQSQVLQFLLSQSLNMTSKISEGFWSDKILLMSREIVVSTYIR